MEDCILSRTKSILIILAIVLAVSPTAAQAIPSLQKNRSEAKKIEKQINSIEAEFEVAVERYNQANLKLAQTQQKLSEARSRLEAAQARQEKNQEIFNRRAAGIYKTGQGLETLEVVLSSRSFGDFIRAIKSIEFVSESDADLLAQIKKDRLVVAKAGDVLQQQEKVEAAGTRSLLIAKNGVSSRIERRKSILGELNKKIESEERAEEAAALARLASARQPRAYSPSAKAVVSAPPPSVNVPASGRGRAVVQAAMAQLGKPYVWGAAGPNSFDCSGLTMYVYARAGVSLPHSAAAQYNIGRKVSRSNLQPGDLVFGAHGGYIGHVGIYIGNDSYIQAPQSGDVVKISRLSARRNYIGATRP